MEKVIAARQTMLLNVDFASLLRMRALHQNAGYEEQLSKSLLEN